MDEIDFLFDEWSSKQTGPGDIADTAQLKTHWNIYRNYWINQDWSLRQTMQHPVCRRETYERFHEDRLIYISVFAWLHINKQLSKEKQANYSPQLKLTRLPNPRDELIFASVLFSFV